MRVAAIGDVHGHPVHLNRLVSTLLNQRIDKLVFLGDLIDRGPDSRGVINAVMNLKHRYGDNVIICRGNHDAMMLETSPNGYAAWAYSDHGAKETLESYIGHDDTMRLHINFLREDSQLYYENGNHVFVHAGIKPLVPMEEQREDDLLWIRDEFLDYKQPHEKYIVHGHTISDTGIDIRDNRCNLDVGCFKHGFLCGAVFDTESENLKPVDAFYASETDVKRII